MARKANVNKDGAVVDAHDHDLQANRRAQALLGACLPQRRGELTMAAACACTATARCQYHARQPRPCPACGGTLQRLSGRDGGRLVRVPVGIGRGYVTRDSGTRLARRGDPVWTCNRCEHCEVGR